MAAMLTSVVHARLDCTTRTWGVDLADQMRRAYTCTRKSKSRWYMRMFWFLFDLAILNSYILESVSPNHVPPIARTGRQKKRYKTHLEFRKQLALELIGDHSSRGNRGRPRRHIPAVWYAEQHFPTQLQVPPACVVCSKPGSRRRTKYGCSLCGDIHMCPYPILKSITPIK